jgi:hypothetical protein
LGFFRNLNISAYKYGMNKYYADTNIIDEIKPMSYSYCLLNIKELNDLYSDLIEVRNADFSKFKRLLP